VPSSLDDRLADPITSHMRRDFPRLHVNQTVGNALVAIRESPPEGRIIYFYVVDGEDRLKGVVPTRRLLLNAPSALVGDIMVPNAIAIPKSATVLEACEYFARHRLLAFPIVDDESLLIGTVDVELYTDEMKDLERREGSDELFQLIGVHLADSQQTSSVRAFQSRFPWLLANIAGGILAAALSGLFEAELKKAVSLALFIPVVLALAESVGIQSVSLALQVLRGKQPTVQTVWKKLRLEFSTGLLLGSACAIAVAGMALGWLGQVAVACCLLGGIAGGVTCAAIIGALVPNLLRLLQKEPQVAAGPIALACTDMVTLTIYLTLARWLLA
jgi:magnesium transporter